MNTSATITLLDAPSNLGLAPPAVGRQPGVRRLPEALRASGLQQRLAATDAGRVPAPPYRPEIETASGVRNASAIAAYSRRLAGALEPLLASGRFPLVLGGDCSVLLGSALALKRRGRYALCFVDGHQDLLTPATSQTGGAAGMDLALACGVGPDALTRLDGLAPLVAAADVLLLGDRSGDRWYSDPQVRALRRQMFQAGLSRLRRQGIARSVAAGLARLDRPEIDGLWLHLDADVLDDAIMPAVDSPQPGGLSWAELHELLLAVLASGRVAGMQVTILDPDLDPDGRYAAALVAALEAALVIGNA